MPPLNKRKHHLEAVKKSKAEHAYKEIDKKADSYFEVLLAAAKNNNFWKVAVAQYIKSITSYLSLINSLRFNIALTSTYKFLAADAAVQLMETNLVDEAVDTIVINKDGDTIIVDNAVDSIVKSVEININNNKAYIKQAIEKLDNMLEKDSKQIDKELSEFLYESLRHIHLTVEQHLVYSEIPNRYITETLEVGINHDGTIFVFAFDNSSSHGAFAEDALVASRMNVKYEDEEKICCNIRKLARQPDFMEQKNILEDIIYSQGLQNIVPEALASVDIITIRKFAKRAW
ncbi:14043_t:CDS:2 [Cetraspora pellucida]|uniref:14043_t:CDS:1 n=1 Tax=Cetraspora pellucida TaxID=1433469 RepID=A0A9N9E6F4_9GLOM|nr:14043_t:CDS:2 [Cetraspora pellucida]